MKTILPVDANHMSAYCFINKSELLNEFRIIFDFYDQTLQPQIVIHEFRFNCDAFVLNLIATVAATLYINRVFKKKGTIYTSSQPVGSILSKGGKTTPKYGPIISLFKKHSEGITGKYLPTSEMPPKYEMEEYQLITKDDAIDQLIGDAARAVLKNSGAC